VDALGNEVRGVTLSPATLQVTVPIVQKQGFREVAVKVFYTGQVASGYQVTGVTVSPVIITVSSGDPRLVDRMPGFVETQPLDISGASDDIIRRLPLQLPPGVNVEGDQTVVVQVSIAAIEYSVRIVRRVEVRGLAPGLSATLSPETVDVLILGPLAVLDRLTLTDVRVVLDLASRAEGVYRLVPEIVLVDDRLRAESIFPSQIEVVIAAATPTPTITPLVPGETGEAGATATATPTPSPTPTVAPRRPTPIPTP
jgi:YbbR domain-containing protein